MDKSDKSGISGVVDLALRIRPCVRYRQHVYFYIFSNQNEIRSNTFENLAANDRHLG